MPDGTAVVNGQTSGAFGDGGKLKGGMVPAICSGDDITTVSGGVTADSGGRINVMLTYPGGGSERQGVALEHPGTASEAKSSANTTASRIRSRA